MIFGSCVAFFTVIVGHIGPKTDMSTARIVTHRGARSVFAARQASAAPDIGQGRHVHPMYSTTGAYVPAKNQTMPCYFSGTACRAGGAIYPAAGANMVDSQLTINGEVVCTVTATPPMMYAAMFPSVIFDSTHFANGSVVTVTASGHDSLGNFSQGREVRQSRTVRPFMVDMTSRASARGVQAKKGSRLFRRIVPLRTSWRPRPSSPSVPMTKAESLPASTAIFKRQAQVLSMSTRMANT